MSRNITVFLCFCFVGFVSLAQTTHNITVAVNQPEECSVVAGLEESDLFSIYPNPVSNSFTVSSDFSGYTLQIFDLDGRELQKSLITENTSRIDVSKLKRGTYILRYTLSDMSDQIKIVVQ